MNIMLKDFVAIVAILASIVSIYISCSVKYGIDIKLNQYESMNKIHDEIAQTFYDLEDFLDELMLKYHIEKGKENSLSASINAEEKQKINGFISRVDVLLAKMFIVMPDDKYKIIKDTVKSGKSELKEIRECLLVAMRQTQFPKTKFKSAEDIRLIYKIK